MKLLDEFGSVEHQRHGCNSNKNNRSFHFLLKKNKSLFDRQGCKEWNLSLARHSRTRDPKKFATVIKLVSNTTFFISHQENDQSAFCALRVDNNIKYVRCLRCR